MIFPQSPKYAQVSFAHSHVPTLRRSLPAIGALELQAQMNDFRCRMARNDVSHANDITFGSQSGGAATSGSVSRWNQGSATTMQATRITNPNNRPFRG